MMNMILMINLNDDLYSTRFEQALDTKQSLSFICTDRFSYKRRNRWLECSDRRYVC